MKKSVNNCIGYNGQIPKHRDFRKFEKSAFSKIENLVDISMYFNDRVIRPLYGDLNPIIDTDFSRRVGWYQFPIFLSRAPQAAIPATALGQDLATKWGHVFVAKGPAHWAKPHADMNFSRKLPGLNLQ